MGKINVQKNKTEMLYKQEMTPLDVGALDGTMENMQSSLRLGSKKSLQRTASKITAVAAAEE